MRGLTEALFKARSEEVGVHSVAQAGVGEAEGAEQEGKGGISLCSLGCAESWRLVFD
jgi:hypothetical protein